MTRITPDIIKSLITKEGRLYIPENLVEAIANCTVSDVSDIRAEGERLKILYDEFSKKQEPIVIDYSNDLTVDAYSVYYLPRNTLVPKTAILCCAYNTAFQLLPKRLRILDIGSGTGGVVLGLLDLFSKDALSGTSLDIVALDASENSLKRQVELVRHMGIRQSTHKCYKVDLSDPQKYEDKLSAGAPYDMVFAANLFAELNQPASDALLEHISPLLSENGIMVNVESQSNYAMMQRAHIAKKAKSLDLHMYYPCPPNLACPKDKCWMWRTDEFECSDIILEEEAIETTKIQIAHWTIFCSKPHSIYETIPTRDPELVWGVAAPYPPIIEGAEVKHGYEICTERGRLSGTITQKANRWILSMQKELFKRGSIIGITNTAEIKETWDIVSGFVNY